MLKAPKRELEKMESQDARRAQGEGEAGGSDEGLREVPAGADQVGEVSGFWGAAASPGVAPPGPPDDPLRVELVPSRPLARIHAHRHSAQGVRPLGLLGVAPPGPIQSGFAATAL